MTFELFAEELDTASAELMPEWRRKVHEVRQRRTERFVEWAKQFEEFKNVDYSSLLEQLSQASALIIRVQSLQESQEAAFLPSAASEPVSNNGRE
jgi:hypothetical protein